MDLNAIWFVLIMVLFTGFFILEGFDYGVGMLLIGRSEYDRSMMIRAIGPVWDGNEVWMITAGGAMFAAFPHVYATMFSTFYIALFLMLLGLIFRGVAFELRGKYPSKDWRLGWDAAIVFGSLVPALLWGVAVTNLLQGLKINAYMHYIGNFGDLLSPYTLVGGLAFVFVFIFHGAAFLTLKIGDEGLKLDIQRKSIKFGVIAALLYVMMATMTLTSTDILDKGIMGVSLFALGAINFLTAIHAMWQGRAKVSFIFTTMAIALTVVQFFTALFPRLMVSSLNPDWSLTIYNAASTPHTLMIMTGAALVFVPIVLCYQAWTYRLFKERITARDLKH